MNEKIYTVGQIGKRYKVPLSDVYGRIRMVKKEIYGEKIWGHRSGFKRIPNDPYCRDGMPEDLVDSFPNLPDAALIQKYRDQFILEGESLYVYSKPFPSTTKTEVITNGPAHTGLYIHAIDFLLPMNTEVFCPHDGIVVDLKDDSDQGGPSEEFKDEANYITLDHGNKEYSQLVHLKHEGVVVKKGDQVKEGALVGYVGMTGWTTAPHLHFMVFKVDDNGMFERSVKIRFR